MRPALTVIDMQKFFFNNQARKEVLPDQNDFQTVISTDATFSDRPKHEEVMFEVIRKEQEQKIVTNQELKKLVADRRMRN